MTLKRTRPCCLLPAHIPDAQVGEGGPAPSAVCAALLCRLTGLRSLNLWNGEHQVSREALQQLSCLSQGALTSLHLYRMYHAGNEVRSAGCREALGKLRPTVARCSTACFVCASVAAQGRCNEALAKGLGSRLER